MNREIFNEKKKQSRMNNNSDAAWAEDVSFTSLEKKITESKKASELAFRSLDDKPDSVNENRQESFEEVKPVAKKSKSSVKKSNKGFFIFLGIWSAVLIIAIGLFIYRFYYFLVDYEKEYQASLPYHVMDDFMQYFSPVDIDSIYASLTDKPVINEFEIKENAENYMLTLLDGKEITYTEAAESTDKSPVYHVVADNYIIGNVTLSQDTEKRRYELPIYHVEGFDMYTEPEWDVSVQAFDNCTVYINNIKVSPEYVYKIDLNKEKHFEEFTNLPLSKYYKVEGLYERPTVKVINGFGEEIIPELNNSTGVYETPYQAPKEIEDEMIEFAKKAVYTYAQVVCREVNDSALDAIFTKDNMIVKIILYCFSFSLRSLDCL